MTRAFSTQNYDLVILCQSVHESVAKEIIAQARALQPAAKLLAISPVGEYRQLGVPGYQADFRGARDFVDAVAALLAPA